MGFLIIVVLAAKNAAAEATSRLATDDTQIEVGMVNNQPAITQLKAAGSDFPWIKDPFTVPLMSHVWVEGREIATQWVFRNRSFYGAGEPTLVLFFDNAEPRLTLVSFWRATLGPGPIEHWIEIHNESSQPVTLSHQDSLSIGNLNPGAEASCWWIRRGGGNASTQGGTFVEPIKRGKALELRSNCDDGASPVPWLAVQVGGERGLYVGWEFSGLGRIEAKAADDGQALEIRAGNLPEFKTDIGPGETFLVPPAFVGCYAGDIDDGAYSLHQWIVRSVRPPVPDGVPDPILAYNLYLDAGGPSAKEADVLRSAAFCHDLGFEAFMPDAMWFPACGDWRWDPARFPSGVTPIEEYVHSHDMRLALWCAWTNGGIAEDSEALSVRGPAGNPNWFDSDPGPDWKPGPFYGARICLACPEAKEWAIRKTQWLVGHHKLDYLKHDCGPIVNACNKTTHRHHYGVDASYWATMGYYDVQEKLRQAFPGLILENCSGGGHIKDFGIVRRTHHTVTTDTLSNLPDRQSIYDSTFALPPIVLQAYTYEREYKVPGDDPGSFLWRSAMMGAWQIDPTNTRIWTEEDRDCARRHAEIYKNWIRPMLKDVKVHHILPRPDGKHWDGMFYWSAGLNRGTLYIFRPDSQEDRQTVKLKGLVAANSYWVWSEDGSIDAGNLTGAQLMDQGLGIALSSQYSSDLIYVQDDVLGRPDGLEPPGAFQRRDVQTDSDPFKSSAKLAWEASPHARSYRVLVSDSAAFDQVVQEAQTTRNSATLVKLPPGKTLYWKVQAVSWGGKQWNDGAPGTFVAAELKKLVGVAFASDMEWVRATAGADNSVHRDTNYHGKEIAVAGKSYPKGVWTHAFNDATPADVAIYIAGRDLETFVADAGVEDSAGAGSVQFQVLADGVMAAESPVLKAGVVHHFQVNVAGVKQVILRVLNGGDGYACDHAAWGGARFIEAGAKDPFSC